MLDVFGWILWGVLALATLSLWFGIFTAWSTRRPFTYATLLQAAFFTMIVATLVFIPEWSKLHILWTAPLVFFGTPILAARFMMR